MKYRSLSIVWTSRCPPAVLLGHRKRGRALEDRWRDVATIPVARTARLRIARSILALASGSQPGLLDRQAAIVSLTAATSCLSVNGFGRKANCPPAERFFSKASSA